jgi:hypothetical protein
MPTTTPTIEDKLKRSGPGDSKASVKWLYSMAPKLRSSTVPVEAFNARLQTNVFIGGMFIYGYDPKTKDTLPWYDTLPVIIPISIYNDGWLGMNLHYLPPMLRAKLLDKLLYFKKREGTPRAYMKVSYQFLNGLVKDRWFGPTIHRYLGNHVVTRMLRVDDKYWEQVAMLPLQKFIGATSREIWSQTR